MSEEQISHPSATLNPSDGQLSGSSDTNNKIFIVGLSGQTTDDSLNKYFSKFGKVTKCGVVYDAKTKSSRGFGFVEFETQNQSSAVLSFDPHKIDGKVISVKPWVDKQKQKNKAVKKRTRANPQKRADTKAMTNKKGIVKDVKNNNMNEMRGRKKEIVEVTKCGVVYDAKTKSSRGFGFVEFETQNQSSAVLSFDPHKIDGKVISVKPWVDKQKQKNKAVKKRTRANPQKRADTKAMTNKKGIVKDVKNNNMNEMRGRKKEIVEGPALHGIVVRGEDLPFEDCGPRFSMMISLLLPANIRCEAGPALCQDQWTGEK
ncbi:hypothetical protein niasHT_013786 [Heterodera trifolii]|uniref:RRM domain-containing protein n=1 Tax=Heterodera trifolii TaxID=157864 RepID=A0ABD2KTQ5_9BILA